MSNATKKRYPRIIAAQSKNRFLVQIDEDNGRIINLNRKIYFSAFPLQSIVARGYWEDYEAKDGELESYLKQCRDEDELKKSKE